MHIIHKDLKQGLVKVQIQHLDDLWYLSTIIDTEDRVTGKTYRKIKLGGESDRTGNVITKTIVLTITVEKIEFQTTATVLRISGKIAEGTDEIAKGSYHTLALEPGVTITIKKERWFSYQLHKLQEATKERPPSVLICVLDREHATFAALKRYGYEILSELSGDVQKKADLNEGKKQDFFLAICKQLEAYDQRYSLHQVVIASPGFWKDYVMKALHGQPLAKKVIYATCHATGKQGIHEVLLRPEIMTALKEDQIVFEVHLVDELMSAIATNKPCAYGAKEVKHAASMGAVKKLLVVDTFLLTLRSEGKYAHLDQIMRMVDEAQGSIHLISSEHEAGQRLLGLGGIGAILRYSVH